MARITGSWLSGPQAGLEESGKAQAYRGELLGLPESGSGSLATSWRRVLALLADWLMAYGISLLFMPWGSHQLSTVVLAVWFIIGVLAVSLFSFTPGQAVLGLRVTRIDHAASKDVVVSVGVWRALVRQILIVFLVPALINDADGRGMHDRATGTALIRTH